MQEMRKGGILILAKRRPSLIRTTELAPLI
jgi:hypothetical protein